MKQTVMRKSIGSPKLMCIIHCIHTNTNGLPEYVRINSEEKPNTYKVVSSSTNIFRTIINKSYLGMVCTKDGGRDPIIFDLDKEHLVKTWNDYLDVKKARETDNYNRLMLKLNSSYMDVSYCD